MDDQEMKRLKQAKLFGAGLITINTPVRVGRYNECLAELGITPTALDRFQIDGMGWSPEVAWEKRDNLYLATGEPNHSVIILTPQQRNKPIYFPFNSYDRRLMETYFNRYINAILDIATTSYLALDIDQELTTYTSPRDLLLVDYIIVRTSAGKGGKLIDAAREQLQLAAEFSKPDLTWFSPVMHEKICESGKIYGDLRFRRADIPDMRFDDLNSFHTRAFGGVYVFRFEDGRSMLVLEDHELMQGSEVMVKDEDTFSLSDPNLLSRLLQENLVEVDLEFYRKQPHLMEEKREYFIGHGLCSEDADLDYFSLTSAQKKRRLTAIQKKMSPAFFELEQLIKKVKGKTSLARVTASEELRMILMRPSETLPEPLQEVVWHLICKLQGKPLDILRLYTVDKNSFFQQYRTWPESTRIWAVHIIGERYVPRMSR